MCDLVDHLQRAHASGRPWPVTPNSVSEERQARTILKNGEAGTIPKKGAWGQKDPSTTHTKRGIIVYKFWSQGKPLLHETWKLQPLRLADVVLQLRLKSRSSQDDRNHSVSLLQGFLFSNGPGAVS